MLRFADVGVATYASLRVVGQPSRTVTWVVEEPTLVAALEKLARALPDPHGPETQRDAVQRAIATGPFASPSAEMEIARDLGSQLLAAPAWQLLTDCATSPRAALFVSPSARLARVPWAALAMPGDEGFRLIELVDVLMAAPPNIANASRRPVDWHSRKSGPPLLVLDPRVPGQRPDSPLGSVLGRPSAESPLARSFQRLDATSGRYFPVSQRRSSCSVAPTRDAPGWPGFSRSRRAGCSTSATRRPLTAMSVTRTARRCTSPTTVR